MKRLGALTIAAVAVLVAPAVVHGQSQGPSRLDGGGVLQVGGEAERYLRVLELAGLAPNQPWTIRPVTMPALNGNHPWRAQWTVDSAGAEFRWRWLGPSARAALNTTFPYNVIPGPAWVGRGITVQLTGGVYASWGRIRAQLEPTAFATQNAAFDLAPNGLTGQAALRDPRFPMAIDAPQRFGNSRYARLDPGSSTLALDVSPLVVGFSTAAQSWGPAREFPLVLSPNAGGFAHAFLATGRPVDLWFARLHGRLIAGSLERSRVARPVPRPDRWASGLALTLLPRGIDGLEVGGSRFVEATSATGVPTLGSVGRLFSRGLRASLPEGGDNRRDENQMGSVWFRWAVPAAHTEFYGEYYREDYALDLRWFLQYPDDLGAYVLGFQHVRRRADGRLRTFRAEVVNSEISSSNKRQRPADPAGGRSRLDGPHPPYLHGGAAYGHTHRGLILGSPEAYGGAAWRVGFDDYDARGRSSLTLERRLRFDWLPGMPRDSTPSPDVIFALRAERVRFVGGREIGVTLVPMIDLNRNLRPGQDQFNLAAAMSVRTFR